MIEFYKTDLGLVIKNEDLIQLKSTYVKETIEFIVKVKINYENREGRVEAINKAKSCLLSTSILGSTGVRPKSAKLIKKL